MITIGIMIIGLGIGLICFALLLIGGFVGICLIPVAIVLCLLKALWKMTFDKEN